MAGRKRRCQRSAAAAMDAAPRCEFPTSTPSSDSDLEILSVSIPVPIATRKRRHRKAATKVPVAALQEVEEETDIEAEVIETKPTACLADNEVAAILNTEEASLKQDSKPQRRLLDFLVHDESGNGKPIELLQEVPLYITAVVLPMKGLLEKRRGFTCQCFGPLQSWSISGYEDGKPVLWISTDVADYICSKPIASYKNWYLVLADKSAVCVAVSKILCGKPELPLDSLAAKVARGSKKCGFSQPFSREYLVSIGGFVCEQLKALDEGASDNDQVFAGLPALVSLEEEWSAGRTVGRARTGRKNAALTIREPGEAVHSPSDRSSDLIDQQHGDEQLAQLLQEQEDRSARRRTAPSRPKKSYIKINEDELAADYPLPEFYKAEQEEADEYLVMDESGELDDRMLHGWVLYNSDMRFVSLELLPMASGAETDMEVFGSGCMTDDNLEYRMDNDQGDSTSTADMLRIYLSSIKEWKIEFGAEFLSISVRTTGAWYRLGAPSAEYAAWFTPVLKTARVARKIFCMYKSASRVSRLSFAEAIKGLAEQPEDCDTYIGSKVKDVERYVAVHGQILLQQFSEYPDVKIKRCSFVTGLEELMRARHHTELKFSRKKSVRGSNLNPRARLQPDVSKAKQMRATTTQLINRIWSDYYSKFSIDGDSPEPGTGAETEQDHDDQKPKGADVNVRSLEPGEAVRYAAEGGDDAFLLVEHTYKSGGREFVHGRVLVKGSSTVLGNAASTRELFLTERCDDVRLKDAKEIVSLELRRRPWGYMHKKANAAADEEDRIRARDRETRGLPMEYFCQALYVPEKGGFFRIPHEKMALGTGTCESCKMREELKVEKSLTMSLFADRQGFRMEGLEYRILDFIYVEATETASQDDAETVKGGRNKGRRAYTICQLLEIKPTSGKTQLTVRKLYRPEDVDPTRAYKADVHEVYYCEQTNSVALGGVRGKCTVVKLQDFTSASQTKDLFFCSCIYDPKKGTVKQLPAHVRLGRAAAEKSPSSSSLAKAKGKGKLVTDDGQDDENSASAACKLLMLDIFAGCGGLSEGLHQSGIASTKWAIEYDRAAADAFKANHPAATVFCENCNVILRSIMEINGDIDDCCSPPEAAEMAVNLTEEQKKNLPLPGEVDFISGGPPCQGFSGMNRFNQRAWSKVQCEMILGFLSYADYFRPRYFLLENVRNFVSFNKGQTFRLTLASLLAMGYQVRFGILQAGHYGVSQSRTRAFIWAAAPDEVVPEWPEPRHVFASSQLKIPLPGNLSYAAVHDTCRGAPLRSMTVRDTIEDLPAVTNGTENPEIAYGDAPQSWFQKNIRGEANVLLDHICKEMNELNLIRCQRIPKRPGADWRDLPDEKVKLSTEQTVDLIPWCLPNTAERHNQWKGLFGRLDWDGNFPTSVTDPQPMGKVGMCFHPVQDRIVTVRECARSQGFRDSYRFHGTIQSKHRQIGNAVPPLLAKALGEKLAEAVCFHS